MYPSPGDSAVVWTADLVALYQSIYSYQRIVIVLRDSSFAMMFVISVDSIYGSLDHTERFPKSG